MMRTTTCCGLALALGLSSALITGCYSPEGGWLPHSGGPVTYYSTEEYPKTITLVDTRTNEVLFTMDVPVGKQLSIDFDAGQGDDPVNTPDLMRYSVWDIGTMYGRLGNSLSVPNASCRRVDMSIRPGVEYAQKSKEAQLRTDQESDRPDWWTSKGGPLPEQKTTNMYDN
ncbi:MAG TPA: hypothetical protein VG711_05185 [Phycisphaerales bacterium]|nr:hypothetical protein [Phycisphaerales bacterium]